MSWKTQYELEEQIGEGSFSKVYRAHDRDDDQTVVLKRSERKEQPLGQHLQNQTEEVKILGILREHPHPNIVNQRDLVQEEDYLITVEEFCSGGDLLAHMLDKKEPLSEEYIKYLMWGLLDGTHHLHQLGVVHRDLKLENILLHKGVPKITDFNLASFWREDKTIQTFCGSLSYCAPEILLRKPYVGPEIDVWSLGVILFGLVFSRFPFFTTQNEDRSCLIQKICSGELQFPSTRPTPPSMEVLNLLMHMMDVNPQTRSTIPVIKQHPWFKSLRESVADLLLAPKKRSFGSKIERSDTKDKREEPRPRRDSATTVTTTQREDGKEESTAIPKRKNKKSGSLISTPQNKKQTTPTCITPANEGPDSHPSNSSNSSNTAAQGTGRRKASGSAIICRPNHLNIKKKLEEVADARPAPKTTAPLVRSPRLFIRPSEAGDHAEIFIEDSSSGPKKQKWWKLASPLKKIL